MTDKIVVLTNCGSAAEARKVALRLVETRVAACVNIIPGVQSIYRWAGKVEESDEWTLAIKSTRAVFERLRAEIEKVHSYSVPEVIALPVVDGTQDYLAWIEKEVGPEGGPEVAT